MTAGGLTKADLRAVYVHLCRYEIDASLVAVRDRIQRAIAEAKEPEKGSLVFAMLLPLALAPSLNVYASMKPWQRAKLRKAIDSYVFAAALASGKASRLTSARRRFVRCVRRSSAPIDEVSVDVVGGKAAVDRLVQANVLAGDSAKWLVREAAWEKAPPGKGSFLVEVFENA